MEEESKRQRQENDVGSFPLAKRPRPCGHGDDVTAWLSMDDDDDGGDTVDYELMSLLDSTDGNAVGEVTRVKFIDNPYSSTLVFQSSSSYVTINGNEESCGSSFSDSESSVMASVDRGGWLKEWERGPWGPNEAEANGWIVDDEVVEVEEEEDGGAGGLLKGGVMVGWDGSDLDDYVLAPFLGEHSTF